ncbi:hypothetical protein [Marinobacter sp.]|uniref:hypothetical protein n=1 Tax=Marinobacter sp. TaxID=50741 RepID=UPI0035C75168
MRIPLEKVLCERFASVVIENDCVAALAGERMFGAVQDEPNCAYVTWSTGVGFGLCCRFGNLGDAHGQIGLQAQGFPVLAAIGRAVEVVAVGREQQHAAGDRILTQQHVLQVAVFPTRVALDVKHADRPVDHLHRDR